jgi:serine phosphatase RsbU (regulator of sigma subunit)
VQQAVRRYIARILGTHIAFLLIVMGLIAGAGAMLYRSLAGQAEAEAIEQLRDPANRAADSVARHLDGVLDTAVIELPAPRPAMGIPNVTGDVVAQALWDQLAPRVSDLMVVVTDPGRPVVRARFGNGPDAVGPAGLLPDRASANAVVVDHLSLLRETIATERRRLIGPVPVGPDQEPTMLVVAPAPALFGRAALVAAVPISYLSQNFLSERRDPRRTSLLLLSAEARVIGGAGNNNGELLAVLRQRGDLPERLVEFLTGRLEGRSLPAAAVSDPVRLNGVSYDGALALVMPIRQGRRPGEEVEALVRSDGLWLAAVANRGPVLEPLEQVTRTAILWAGVLVAAVTVTLISSGIQLVRGRSRLERLRNEMVDRELREARAIQLRWLPEDDAHRVGHHDLDLAARNLPASHISGDFYNYFDLPDGKCALVIGDVTGHGMAAAFLMSTTQLLVRTTLQRLGDPGETLTEVNAILAGSSTGGQFVTLLLAVLDLDGDSMEIASAGHAGPLACGKDGRWAELEVEAELVLGVAEGIDYPTQHLDLGGATAMLFYTDGAVEVQSPDGDRFELRRFTQGLQTELPAGPQSAKDVVAAGLRVVSGHAAGADFDDDVTLLAACMTCVDQPDGVEPAGTQALRPTAIPV